MKNKISIYTFMLASSLGLLVLGFILSDFSVLADNFGKILFASDILITDYVEIAGAGPALINAALVTLITIGMLFFNKVEANGYVIGVTSLMCGFSLFGKNVFNIWFILLGSYLYAKWTKAPFSKHLCVGLLSTALSPIISFVFFTEGIVWTNVLVAIAIGISIGFVMPPLADFTRSIHKGYILYNVGFACGLLALVIVPIMKSYGVSLSAASYWSTGNNTLFAALLYSFSFLLICIGLLFDRSVLKKYVKLLKSTGVSPSDFIQLFGKAPVLLNMGLNGIIATSYILLIKGDLNGPTLGGILTIMGFGAFGKHPVNTIPIILGILLGGFTKQWSLTDPSIQIAALFSTTLVPISGAFGPLAGVLAGFIHSSVVLHAGGGYNGMNLYNNGYAGGVVFLVVFPLFSLIRDWISGRKHSPNKH